MLSDEVIEKVIERLVNRIENINLYVLKQIAKTIKKMGTITTSDTSKLVEILNYGGDYEKIVKQIAKVTELNEKEIYEIFDEVAKTDYQFARQFYKYRNKKYIPYKLNKQLKEQVKAIAKITAEEYKNISRTLAFSRKVNGKVVYSEIGKVYQDVVDEGIIALGQGKDTFNQQMTRIIKELGRSGLRSVDWQSGVSRRLDSAVRMHLQAGVRNLHNEMQQTIAKDIKADGIEISVHNNPAPDHEEAQGRQFTINQYNEQGKLIKKGEWEKLQEDGIAKDYTGKEINLHNNSTSFRPISQYNCYHYTFSIVLGVNQPQYSDKQLQQIIDRNDKGFEYEGEHYTMYQGTQLQRKIELAIRKEKDTQIMAKEANQDELVQQCEKNIDTLLDKYVEVSNVSGLPTKMERLKVPGYRQIKVAEETNITPKIKYKDYYMGYNDKTSDERFERVIEVSNIFDNKYKKVYEQLNDEEVNALKKYSGHYYKDIQKTLLNKDIDDTENYIDVGLKNISDYKKEVNKWIENIDSGINKGTIDENIVLWKGTKASYYNDLKENEIFSSALYNSTSINRNVAESYVWNKENGIVLKILVPKGTKAMYMDKFGIGEQELLLPRNLRYKYIRTYRNKPSTEYIKSKEIKIIELEVIK